MHAPLRLRLEYANCLDNLDLASMLSASRLLLLNNFHSAYLLISFVYRSLLSN